MIRPLSKQFKRDSRFPNFHFPMDFPLELKSGLLSLRTLRTDPSHWGINPLPNSPGPQYSHNWSLKPLLKLPHSQKSLLLLRKDSIASIRPSAASMEAPNRKPIRGLRRRSWQPTSWRERSSNDTVSEEGASSPLKRRTWAPELKVLRSVKSSSKLGKQYIKPEYLPSLMESPEPSIREITPLINENPSSLVVDVLTPFLENEMLCASPTLKSPKTPSRRWSFTACMIEDGIESMMIKTSISKETICRTCYFAYCPGRGRSGCVVCTQCFCGEECGYTKKGGRNSCTMNEKQVSWEYAKMAIRKKEYYEKR
jgi:hypothetical protein